jgi:hypothetical protein
MRHSSTDAAPASEQYGAVGGRTPPGLWSEASNSLAKTEQYGAVGGRTPPSNSLAKTEQYGAVGGRTPPPNSLAKTEQYGAVGGRTPPYDYPALCIPRGLGKITHDELNSIINKSGLGEVYKIIIKPKEFVLPRWERTAPPPSSSSSSSSSPCHSSNPDDTTPQTVCYNNIYIYFKKWNTDNPTVRKYRDNIINGQSIKIVHNAIPTPIFWRCVAANFYHHEMK